MKRSPKASLERKLARIVREHAAAGEPLSPDQLANDILRLTDSASKAEQQYLLEIGALTLAAKFDISKSLPQGPVL